jgi:ABC-type dipeptide/oligopeptide/nickel transport system ATPase component
MMFQDARASLNPARTVRAQLLSVLRQHTGQPETSLIAEAERLLRQVRLVDVERVFAAYPSELSGGMAQRIALALALACRPQLLIADEPTAALDATVAVAIVALLREVQAEAGLSMLVISHDMNVVRNLCDHISVLSAGCLVEQGPTEQLLSRPQHRDTIALVEASEWRLPTDSQ